MTEDKYKELLGQAPADHYSDEFISYLMKNNKVREYRGNWLIIENCKYWNEENDWLTAFYIGKQRDESRWAMFATDALWERYFDREWKIKDPTKRSVKLFHIHLYKNNK